ncbi:MAG: hypothetical protein GY927_05385, partial [bacterium]|nr:hypothetical protein [bacterium]
FIALATAILLPGGRRVEENPRLPWAISVDDAGRTTVFGLTLGESDLADARFNFQTDGEVNLFVSPDQRFSIEAYFDRLFLSGLRGDFIMTLDVDETRAAGMFERGLRISQLGSGAKKVKLAPSDLSLLKQSKITSVTYIPGADLDENLIQDRFGEPSQRIKEASGIVHWLYPDKGLDIGLNPKDKEVFQYTSPSDFKQ